MRYFLLASTLALFACSSEQAEAPALSVVGEIPFDGKLVYNN